MHNIRWSPEMETFIHDLDFGEVQIVAESPANPAIGFATNSVTNKLFLGDGTLYVSSSSYCVPFARESERYKFVGEIPTHLEILDSSHPVIWGGRFSKEEAEWFDGLPFDGCPFPLEEGRTLEEILASSRES